MAKIRFLGTRAALPNKDRMASSILVEGINSALLIDAGEGCAHRLADMDFWRQDIGTIVLTHCHTDHVSGFPVLISTWKLQGRKDPVEVFAPKGLGKGIQSWLTTLRLGIEGLPFPLQIKELVPGKVKTTSGHHVLFQTNSHLPSDSKGRGGSYSIVLEPDGYKCVFTSDIGDINDISGLLPGCRLLIAESFHVNPEFITRAAEENGVDKVVFTHIPIELNVDDFPDYTWAYDNMILEMDK